MPSLIGIYVCADKGLPMKSLSFVWAMKGVGLSGDRYSTGRGAFSQSKRVTVRQVSLIAIEAIRQANATLGENNFGPEETRRNLVTEGIDLNALVGKEFMVGTIRMRGVELCEPCSRPSILIKKPGFEQAFANLGGLRAEILSEGMLMIGETITIG